jgi:hypothetical protein
LSSKKNVDKLKEIQRVGRVYESISAVVPHFVTIKVNGLSYQQIDSNEMTKQIFLN